jgi:phi13 family phage major tail protein
MGNKVKFGINNVHVAILTEGENGAITYGTPIAVPGAVNLTADPVGETTPFYADNVKYYNSISNQGYEGELEVAMIQDTIFRDILGQTIDENGGVLEKSDDKPKRFALMFEVDGDAQNRRTVYYDCTASRPSQNAQTIEESKEPQTDTLAITMSPRNTDKKVKYTLERTEENAAVFNAFFQSVYEGAASV